MEKWRIVLIIAILTLAIAAIAFQWAYDAEAESELITDADTVGFSFTDGSQGLSYTVHYEWDD